MTGSFLGLIEFLALAYFLFALGISVASTALYPLVCDRIRGGSPADRAGWLLALCAAPPGGALLLIAICLLPSASALWWRAVDHCPEHGGGHAHFCFAHLPEVAGSVAGLIALGAVGLFVASLVTEAARTAALGRRLRRAVAGAPPAPDHGVCEIDSSEPLAVTIGLLRPRAFISSALRARLSEGLLAAVLEHEHAHVRRRDSLRRAVAKLTSLLHLPWTRRRLLHDLRLACEQACDEEAAERIGDPLCVARALLAVERLQAKYPATQREAVSAFGGEGITERVEALASDAAPRARASVRAWSLGLLLFLIAIADRLHHSTETLLGLVTR